MSRDVGGCCLVPTWHGLSSREGKGGRCISRSELQVILQGMWCSAVIVSDRCIVHGFQAEPGWQGILLKAVDPGVECWGQGAWAWHQVLQQWTCLRVGLWTGM